MATSEILHRCSSIRESLAGAGLFAPDKGSHLGSLTAHSAVQTTWRISPEPFLLDPDQLAFFHALGPQLLQFYHALNRLYLESVRGTLPKWVAAYLDQGKPEALITFGRMKRFRDQIPAVIRPDIIPTSDGMVITELDSVPGGMGLTAAMSRAYTRVSHGRFEVIGGSEGMVEGFAAMLLGQMKQPVGPIAIIVSEEAKDYRPEMTWMASELSASGLESYCVGPKQIRFTEEGLRIATDTGEVPISLIYRFYELFDLPNIPKAELIQYATKKGLVSVTPPYKPALEEKSAFGLLHHPILQQYWRTALGDDLFLHLSTIMPRTWILDPAPIPPSAVIPGLSIGGRAVMQWTDLAEATQKERHFVVKPSGFSELAWGSRGVSVGHDLSQGEWAAAIDSALRSYSRTPYVLQEFHKGRQYQLDYVDPDTGEVRTMAGRARLSPYYFVTGDQAELAGILATICPADKKIIHGMKDAIMAPCAIESHTG